MKYFGIILSLFLSIAAFAQQNNSDPEAQVQEIIDLQVEQYASQLKLEDWQIFYVDSILNHNFHAMKDEVQSLNDAKVSNTEAYTRIQDKWTEEIYQALQKVFNKEQWNKYLKSGAAKEKKSRDKRMSKIQ